ncbi:MAG: hypothetical protein INH37_25485 [Myxococcaceae bacterium]|nr:hypothetical protein [Myxococcaceae bacterium]
MIRADAGPRIGTGHVMRMLALAEAWVSRGGRFVLTGALPPPLAQRVEHTGGQWIPRPLDVDDGAWTRMLAVTRGAAAVVADGYSFGPEFQEQVVSTGRPLMVVDDNGENREYRAQLVLNLNVHADEAMYRTRRPGSQLLLGPTFALIRREILASVPRSRAVAGPVSECLVTLGGADPLDLTGSLLRVSPGCFRWRVLVGAANPRLEAYQRLRRDDLTLVANTPFFAREALRCQLAFAAAGGTVWELALLNVPSAVVSVAANQEALAARLAELGAVDLLGDARLGVHVTEWVGRLEALANDPPRRQRLIDSARGIVDGRGAERVVSRLLEVV